MSIFDYTNGEYIYIYDSLGDTAFNSDGDMLCRMGNDMAINMNTGEMIITSDWRDDDDTSSRRNYDNDDYDDYEW